MNATNAAHRVMLQRLAATLPAMSASETRAALRDAIPAASQADLTAVIYDLGFCDDGRAGERTEYRR